MDEHLRTLLERLETIGQRHEELGDTEVRQAIGDAVMDGFVRAQPTYVLPDEFGMFSREANAAVRAALIDYITAANERAAKLNITRFHDRLAAVQNRHVQTSVPGHDYEEFFGHTPPESYDQLGHVIRTV